MQFVGQIKGGKQTVQLVVASRKIPQDLEREVDFRRR